MPSTPPRQRSPIAGSPPTAPRAPFAASVRDSTTSTKSATSANLSSIGKILSSPYDSDSESIATARAKTHFASDSGDTFGGYPPEISSPTQVRAGDRRESVRNVPPNYLKSVEGEVVFSGINSAGLGYLRQSEESGRVRPPTIVDFPEPTIAPSPEPDWPPRSPVRSIKYIPSPASADVPSTPVAPQYPAASHPPLRSPYSPHMTSTRSQPARPTVTIPQAPSTPGLMPHFVLPPPASPVSPYLATPPGTILSGPMIGYRGSATSESIRGFDAMKEKKALFRGGEEEIVSAWSPRKREPRPSGLRNARPMTTVDFWKRFSVMRVEQTMMQGGKDSQWLEQQQKSRSRIKIYAYVAVAAVLLIIAAIVAVVLMRESRKTDAEKINNGL